MPPVFGEDYVTRSKTLDRKVIKTQAALPSFEEEIVDIERHEARILNDKNAAARLLATPWSAC